MVDDAEQRRGIHPSFWAAVFPCISAVVAAYLSYLATIRNVQSDATPARGPIASNVVSNSTPPSSKDAELNNLLNAAILERDKALMDFKTVVTQRDEALSKLSAAADERNNFKELYKSPDDFGSNGSQFHQTIYSNSIQFDRQECLNRVRNYLTTVEGTKIINDGNASITFSHLKSSYAVMCPIFPGDILWITTIKPYGNEQQRIIAHGIVGDIYARMRVSK